MGDILNSGWNIMFNRFNTNNAVDSKGNEFLDANEVAKAKQAGFDFFELKENMTQDEFLRLYQDYECNLKASDAEAYVQKQKDIHVKFLQIQYGSNEPIGDRESLDSYAIRLEGEAKIKNMMMLPTSSTKKDMGI